MPWLLRLEIEMEQKKLGRVAERRLETIDEIKYLRLLDFSWEYIASDLGIELESLQKNLERWRKAGLTNLIIPYRVIRDKRRGNL